MKKLLKYVTPEVSVLGIQMETLICTSLPDSRGCSLGSLDNDTEDLS